MYKVGRGTLLMALLKNAACSFVPAALSSSFGSATVETIFAIALALIIAGKMILHPANIIKMMQAAVRKKVKLFNKTTIM